MLRLVSWMILTGVFLLSGYGLNMIRVAVMEELADPSTVIWWRMLIGSVLMFGGLFFLGGFIYYRDKKRGLVRKPAWKLKNQLKNGQHGSRPTPGAPFRKEKQE